MIVVLWIVVVLLYLQYNWVRINLKSLKPFDAINWEHVKLDKVKLSILIPARNEERNIEDCVTAVAEQAANMAIPIEILVLNDCSEDHTGDIVKALMKKYPFVKEIEGKEKPVGWAGKNFACHQLTEAAHGNWYLFLDADARVMPDQLFNIIAVASTYENGLITGFPRQFTKTWMERWVVPMMMFTIGAHLPISKVANSKDPRFVAAHGGFMLIAKETYLASGGHRGIQSELVDDMELARAVKRAGHQVHLVNVTNQVEMHMYHSAKEVFQGYEKNLFHGMGRNAFLLFTMIFLYAAFYVMPFVGLFAFYTQINLFIPALIAYFIGFLTRSAVDGVHKVNSGLSLCMPVSAFFLIIIALISWFKGVTKKGYTWKGRRYS
jgi:cellulose synthase/poly-beta-1,6-N-acetylglucosamine synthase-like glycosyltransferase